MDRSEVLLSRIIDAHEKLWERIVAIRSNLPSPYGEVLGLFQVVTPKELEAVKSEPAFQFSMADTAFMEVIDDRKLDLIRPYIDDTLWRIAKARISFSLRLLYLFATDTPDPDALTNWPEDHLVLEHLRTAFTQKELEQFNYSQPGTFKDIADLWEARIVVEIKKAVLV